MENFGLRGDDGLPALSSEQVLAPHRDIINQIKLCYGADPATFERDLFSLIRRYADFVHLLPATPDNYFSAPGGLLRLSLEVAFFSLQGTDGHIFSGRSTITTRRHLEPRWRHATFIAGLCCELHRAVGGVSVADGDGANWPAYLMPLSAWLEHQARARFFITWGPHGRDVRALGALALPHVVSNETLQDLANDNAIVVPHMIASICGTSTLREHNILDDLVRRSLALVIDRNLKVLGGASGKPATRAHVERYVVDALRRLMRDNAAWKPNSDKSRVWFAADGLFIVWPNAAADIQKLLEADRLAGMPSGPEGLLELLVTAGVCELDDQDKTWEICTPDAKSSIRAVKVSAPETLFGGLDAPPRPLPVRLLSGEARADVPGELRFTTSRAVSNADQANAAVRDAKFALKAPMRLNPAVRDTLARIIDTLNTGGSAVAACTVSSGVFVPLGEFERRNIEPSLALRALADVNMLVWPTGTSGLTVMREFGGEQKSGLVLHPRFVAGLDLASFSVTG